jgi:hypothetical protein
MLTAAIEVQAAGEAEGEAVLTREEDWTVHAPISRKTRLALFPVMCGQGTGMILSDGIALQVPGGANDSMSSNTQLGRAVQDACKELETLGGLVRCLQ